MILGTRDGSKHWLITTADGAQPTTVEVAGGDAEKEFELLDRIRRMDEAQYTRGKYRPTT